MKLIIQIPCYHEEESLSQTIKDLPEAIEGVDTIEYLVIDDGSKDRTLVVAKQLGVHHIVKLKQRRGLAHAFRAGIEACLDLDADIVVNTDGDNQYNADDIPKLISPILNGEAEIVIGERPIKEIKEFSFLKKVLQKWGSAVVSWLANIKIPDTTSGFRAFSRDSLFQLNLISEYTYTLESIIQAGRKKIPLTSVKIRTNPQTRESHLFKSIFEYIRISLGTMLRVWLNYAALKISMVLAMLFMLGGLAIGIRFLYYYLTTGGAGHVQSLILMAVLIFIGFQLIIIGFLADLISGNKRLIEDSSYKIKSIEYKIKNKTNE
jgi:glycosyltransferase involved in cell wall biosynthesis